MAIRSEQLLAAAVQAEITPQTTTTLGRDSAGLPSFFSKRFGGTGGFCVSAARKGVIGWETNLA